MKPHDLEKMMDELVSCGQSVAFYELHRPMSESDYRMFTLAHRRIAQVKESLRSALSEAAK